MGRVVSLQVKRRHWGPLEPVDAVRATDLGLDGDRHAGREDGRRQVLLVEARDLRDLGLAPGELREQLTVDVPGLMGLREGTRLRVGQAVLELTGVCEPCSHIGEHVGVDDREAFRQRLVGRRGMLARVVAPGAIRRNDPVTVEAHADG